ncbi:hypothetical protein OPT61_g8056 [Boeremia exigua]|uniref:Uncharacterized protein n=1 Tax=Boeremia exigua TaxID=749465 RepID=A0ACC2HZS4_9PLEO|nr:hypothetical protein OPT61_g8056 [Boeremia exigua]
MTFRTPTPSEWGAPRLRLNGWPGAETMSVAHLLLRENKLRAQKSNMLKGWRCGTLQHPPCAVAVLLQQQGRCAKHVLQISARHGATAQDKLIHVADRRPKRRRSNTQQHAKGLHWSPRRPVHWTGCDMSAVVKPGRVVRRSALCNIGPCLINHDLQPRIAFMPRPILLTELMRAVRDTAWYLQTGTALTARNQLGAVARAQYSGACRIPDDAVVACSLHTQQSMYERDKSPPGSVMFPWFLVVQQANYMAFSMLSGKYLCTCTMRTS